MLLLPANEFLRCRLGFFLTELFLLLVNAPLVTKRIDELSISRSPEHVLHRHEKARAVRYRTLDKRVSVIYLQRDTHARSAESLRHFAAAAFRFREFIAQEEFVPIEHDFAVHQSLAIGRHHDVTVFSAKYCFVEFEPGLAVADNQVWDELIISMQAFTPAHSGIADAILVPALSRIVGSAPSSVIECPGFLTSDF
jgi:hypothetical protein